MTVRSTEIGYTGCGPVSLVSYMNTNILEETFVSVIKVKFQSFKHTSISQHMGCSVC
jgi:hypothetical protein